MGLSLSLFSSAWEEIVKHMFFDLAYHTSFTSKDPHMIFMNDSFKKTDSETITKSNSFDKRSSVNSIRPLKVMLETSLSFKNLVQDIANSGSSGNLEGKSSDGGHFRKSAKPAISLPEPAFMFSPRNLVQDVRSSGSTDNLEGISSDGGLFRKAAKPAISVPEPAFMFSPKDLVQGIKHSGSLDNLEGKISDGGLFRKSTMPAISLPEPALMFSPRPVSELDAAAVTLQKVYKSYRTRRNLADCAVVVEELWWKALDFASLKQSSVLFFNVDKHETAVSRWSRAKKRLAKVGKGLSKDEKAQKLALQHWLEAIDPRHRYGHNLHFYYDVWFESESAQPFFYWLDVGDGKEVNLKKCPRTNLQRQCIMYLGPKKREAYEVIVENGRLVYAKSGILVETTEGSKWIFVLSTSRNLYVGQKKKGLFQHSSFLAGGATTAAGRLVAHDGILEAIWPYSGHYHPTEENFREFISFLEEHHVDLTNVKRCAIDDDSTSCNITDDQEPKPEPKDAVSMSNVESPKNKTSDHQEDNKNTVDRNVEEPIFNMAQRLSCKWSTGAGPRIGCVRDYPTELQFRALEQVNLSPRVANGVPYGNYGPIPSPRPSPKIRVSPRLAYMGLPSPRTPIPAAN